MPLPSDFLFPSDTTLPSDPAPAGNPAPIPEYPHFDLPFRFEDGQVAVIEQDTIDDVQNQVETVVRCPLEFRDELPAFGWPQPEFETAPLSTTDRQAAIDEWVPSAHAVLTEHGSSVDEAVRIIEIHLNPEQS